ncbi:hypothetical protein N0Y54_25915 [Nostoc punctiforme UO1]
MGILSIERWRTRPPEVIATRKDEIITITHIERWHEVPTKTDTYGKLR